MSFLQNLVLTQFKNYQQSTFHFDAKAIGIAGKNGVGKTNILDAIYYLCFSKSYFQSKEINNVQQGEEGFRLEGDFNDGTVTIIWREGKKRIFENAVPVERLNDFIGKRTALMIAPDDIELINGGSDLRRKFIDALLSQSDNTYFEKLLHYQKILVQRNAYLKQSNYAQVDHHLLDVYDTQLAENGAYLITERIKLSEQLPKLVIDFYQKISGNAEIIAITYQQTCTPDNLAALLAGNRFKDLEARRTTAGPHTEDWLFSMDDKPVKTLASQGQKKSFLIALKLSQLEWLRQLGKPPIVLLDDIFEKLDQNRLSHFFELLASMDIPQVFLTHVEPSAMDNVQQHFESFDMVYLE